MKNKIITIVITLLALTAIPLYSQKVYNPKANAEEDLAEAIKSAKIENKNIFISVGGNWCEWCVKFHKYCKKDLAIDSLIKSNYVILKVNWSDDNKNPSVMKKLGNPDKLGFPVFVILDKNGNTLHTQESGSLFAAGNWDREKIVKFLSAWAN